MIRLRGASQTAPSQVAAIRPTWWLLTGYALVASTTTIPVALHSTQRPVWLRAATVMALLLAALGWLIESRSYRSRWLAVALEAIAILTASVSLTVPDAAKSVLFSTVARRGVCASSRVAVVVAVAANSVAFATGVLLVHIFFPQVPVAALQTFADSPGLVVIPVAMRMLVEGLTARAAAERDAASTGATMSAIVETSPVGLLLVDQTGVVRLCNRNAELILDRPATQLVGHPVDTVTAIDDPDGRLIPKAALAGEPHIEHEVPGWARRDGTVADLTVSTAPVPDSSGVVAVVCDVTEQRRLEEQLRQQALHDGLTGLANRTLFLEHTTRALTRHPAGTSTAVLLLDLDAFKTVNDTLGHAIGDALLVEVANRLRDRLHPADLLARLGGDEFAVLLEDGDEAKATVVAERILSGFERPIRLVTADSATAEIRMRVSIGAVVTPESTISDANALLRAADLAMYAAKRAGGHRWARYEPAMADQLRERVALEDALREAVSSGALFLEYQPCVSLATRRICAAEALLRWTDPGRGVIPPRTFIPIAEDTGMIVQVGRWVLQEACRQATLWDRSTGQSPTVKVNLSVRQLTEPDLTSDIHDALTAVGLPAERLVLELTESELADHGVLPTLNELKEIGVRLALDDFGTGYSSLAYLRRFPLDVLKIDQAFVAPIATDPSAAALTKSIIDMAHTLGLETVAEGVETAEQAYLLQQMGCQFAQGYHFAVPQSPDALATTLRQGTAAPFRAPADNRHPARDPRGSDGRRLVAEAKSDADAG